MCNIVYWNTEHNGKNRNKVTVHQCWNSWFNHIVFIWENGLQPFKTINPSHRSCLGGISMWSCWVKRSMMQKSMISLYKIIYLELYGLLHVYIWVDAERLEENVKGHFCLHGLGGEVCNTGTWERKRGERKQKRKEILLKMEARFEHITLMAQMVENLPIMWETQVRSLGGEYPLEKGMATLSSILAWRFPGTGEPGGLQSIRWQRLRHNWSDLGCMHCCFDIELHELFAYFGD